ncbi:MAG TPA: recombinase RecB, partial [Thermoplasmatales archaeon]|nr:recombinase RecB [Thermoplasmatales archaeon]
MSKTKGLSSERIAKRLLESRGFHVLSIKHRVMDGEDKVAEVDIVAEDSEGVRYAVEVKAGRGDVNAVRQAFANAKLCGFKPLLVCKGFADDAARKVASKLGVEVVELSEYYL